MEEQMRNSERRTCVERLECLTTAASPSFSLTKEGEWGTAAFRFGFAPPAESFGSGSPGNQGAEVNDDVVATKGRPPKIARIADLKKISLS